MKTARRTNEAGGRPAPMSDREVLGARVFAVMRTLIRLRYFSFEVEGAEHIPREGPVIFAQNHAGWFALDAFFVALAVSEVLGIRRAPVFAVQDSALAAPLLGPFFQRLGAVPASWLHRPERLPPQIDSYGICPEGVRGNCKPFWQAYRMREWHSAFVRIAIARNAPVVPVAVFGGEECLPVVWTVRALKPLVGSIVGCPLVPVPLPARWKVVFHEPVHVAAHGDGAPAGPLFCADVARRIRSTVQHTLDRDAPSRPLARLSSFVAAVTGQRRAANEKPRRSPGGAFHASSRRDLTRRGRPSRSSS